MRLLMLLLLIDWPVAQELVQISCLWSSEVNFWELLDQEILQPQMQFCHPSVCVHAWYVKIY